MYINGVGPPIMSDDQIKSLCFETAKAEIEIWRNAQIQVIRDKAYETRAVRRMIRKNGNRNIIRDSCGYLCEEISNQIDGKFLRCISNYRFISLKRIYCSDQGDLPEIYILSWEHEKELCFSCKELSPKVMKKAIIKAGIHIDVKKGDQADMFELITIFMLQGCSVINVQRCHGIHVLDNGKELLWYVVNDSNTYMHYLEVAYGC